MWKECVCCAVLILCIPVCYISVYYIAKSHEWCTDGWIQLNATGLRDALEIKLHGQHLVKKIVYRALSARILNPNPSKPLVLSFHGWTGGGKNFVSGIIADHLYYNGMSSKFVHTIIGSLSFPHQSNTAQYKELLRDWVRTNTSNCGRSLFIIDEIDKIEPDIIDGIKPYLDHYSEIDGIDYRKTIFLFLSNTAGTSITERTLQFTRDGRRREDITMKEMDEIIRLASFNEKGGLHNTGVVDKNLVSVYVPFLPLTREHVKLCARDDLIAKGYPASRITSSKLEFVAQEMQYHSDLFSTTGCKRVTEKVDLIMEELEAEDLKSWDQKSHKAEL